MNEYRTQIVAGSHKFYKINHPMSAEEIIYELSRNRDLAEMMNQISEDLLGYREGSYLDMRQQLSTLKVSDAILRTSKNAMARRKDIKEACDQLMLEIKSLSDEI